MGGNKGRGETTIISGGGSSSRELTPEERELNKLQLEREKFLDPQLREVQSQGLNLSAALLHGSNQLPGFLAGLPGGISPEVTDEIVSQSLRDIQPQFQQSGLLDSGVNASVSARVAGDIRRASEEFNIGNRLNLLNMALGGQAQVQQPVLGFSQQLGNRLASAGTTHQTFNQTTTQFPRKGGSLFGFF